MQCTGNDWTLDGLCALLYWTQGICYLVLIPHSALAGDFEIRCSHDTYHAQLLYQVGPHGNLQCLINLLFVCLFVWRSFLLHTNMTFYFNLSLSSPPFSSWSTCFRSDGEEPLVKAIHVSSSFVYLHCFLNLHGNIEEKLHQLRVLSAAAKLFVYDALGIQHSWNLGLWMQKVKPSKTPC